MQVQGKCTMLRCIRKRYTVYNVLNSFLWPIIPFASFHQNRFSEMMKMLGFSSRATSFTGYSRISPTSYIRDWTKQKLVKIYKPRWIAIIFSNFSQGKINLAENLQRILKGILLLIFVPNSLIAWIRHIRFIARLSLIMRGTKFFACVKRNRDVHGQRLVPGAWNMNRTAVALDVSSNFCFIKFSYEISLESILYVKPRVSP